MYDENGPEYYDELEEATYYYYTVELPEIEERERREREEGGGDEQ